MQYKKNFIDCFPGIFKFIQSEDKRHCSVEVVVYLFLAHHFCLANKNNIRMSYDDMQHGTDIHHGLGFTHSTLSLAINRLEQLGLIEIKRKRFLDVDGKYKTPSAYKVRCPTALGKIEQFYSNRPESITINANAKNSGQSSYASSFLLPSSEGKEERKKERNEEGTEVKVNNITNKQYPLLKSNSPDKPSILTPKSTSEEFTLLLWDSLGPKYRSGDSKITTWKSQFTKKLNNSTDEEVKRYRKILKWYCNNVHRIGEEYFPIVECPKTFFKKLQSIERKMTTNRPAPSVPTWNDFGSFEHSTPKELSQEEKREREEMRNRAMFDKI